MILLNLSVTINKPYVVQNILLLELQVNYHNIGRNSDNNYPKNLLRNMYLLL